ncbi:low affinity immunoglobulin gamma Fc region receptor III-like isoform X2 [Anabas testudineus]|uniref:low affinity immunoglobulin gamma Fc region receptor III-like isoform X2 n=1 Tax=Anabas testudineus TaxID=64144 RepID=UPI000E463E76|nr:low affinity immunoglobulin gamma Fc region receptor III-like isoform X2 [Anabas testudineus]
MMEVVVFCIRLLLLGVVLWVMAHAAQKNVVFPRIVPDKLQFFEYDVVSVYCDGTHDTEWRVMRKILDINATNYSHWDTSAPSCTIKPAFIRHSGKYWCGNKEGERSDTVNITITGGSVILESPVGPVIEGSSVTLRCRKRKNALSRIADFYKDSMHIKTGYGGEMTITNFSVSDEGLYKCNIYGAGESAESWLTVKLDKVFSALHEENHPAHQWIVRSLLVALFLLVMGLFLCWTTKDKSTTGFQACEEHLHRYRLTCDRIFGGCSSYFRRVRLQSP